jgi:endonuclease/exonuclease/phosphatase family metal-dependent hydrolase
MNLVKYFLFLLFILSQFVFAKPFKVATYNVENLFDAKFQGSEYSDYIPNRHNWNKKMVEIKLNHTAEVICDLNADILALQEIENSNILNLLLKRLKQVGCKYSYSAITHKKSAAIQVALISRFPIISKKELQVSSSPFVRNILEVEVKIDGKSFTLFSNHWKSKSRKGFESKRIKYARRLEKRVNTMPKNREYIILGDLNSNYNAHLTLKKRLDDSSGLTAIGNVLKTVKNGKLIEKYEIPTEKRGFHYNLWKDLPFKDRWNHKFYSNKSTLDHILLAKSMFDGEGIDYVNNSFNVFKKAYMFKKRGQINFWKYKNGKHLGEGYSDHLPIYAFFDTKAYKANPNDKVTKVLNKNIEYLYTIDSLPQAIKLKNVVVIFKRGRYAIVKQKAKGRGIFLYGCVNGLKEGREYDILVHEISNYKGLKEITSLVKLKDRGKVKLNLFYGSLKLLRQNEVLKNFKATYRKGNLYLKEKKIPVYFKNRKIRPKNGSKLKIGYAHVGYYKKLQFVIYSKKDFTILEK